VIKLAHGKRDPVCRALEFAVVYAQFHRQERLVSGGGSQLPERRVEATGIVKMTLIIVQIRCRGRRGESNPKLTHGANTRTRVFSRVSMRGPFSISRRDESRRGTQECVRHITRRRRILRLPR
jgi:hypothetical protein